MSEKLGTFPLQVDDGEDDLYSKTLVIDSESATADRSDEPLPEPDERLQSGSLLRDRYLLQERVEGGSMGVVYKALDRHLTDSEGDEAAVAIKVLTPQLSQNSLALRALQQEAAKGRCLSHPNIVRFIDLDREDSLYFLIMEWLDGESLAEFLDNGTSVMDMARATDIIRQVGEALAYAHRRGVIHADVKPGNVMLLRDGTVKLIDFGIARVRQKQETKKIEESGLLNAATPAYSSMQVLTGEEPTVADDVFSLACLAYRLFAGHRVFGPRNAAQAAQEGMEPQRPPSVSDRQWKALRKGLAYSRVTRHAGPMDLVNELLIDVPASAVASPAASMSDDLSEVFEATSPTPGTLSDAGLATQAAPAAAAEPATASQPPAEEKPPAAAANADVMRASRGLGSEFEHDESLAIPRDAFIEQRYETAPRRLPYGLILTVLLALTGALILRPDWRELAIDKGEQWLTQVKQMTGIESGSSTPATEPVEDTAPPVSVPVQADAIATDNVAANTDPEPVSSEPDTSTAADSAGADEATPADTPAAAGSAVNSDAPAVEPEAAAEAETPAVADTQEPAPAPSSESQTDDPVSAEPAPPPPRETSTAGNAAPAGPSLALGAPGEPGSSLELSLTEGSAALNIELQRRSGLSEPLLVRIDEVGFSGSRSPAEEGRYRLSDDGIISFDAGQRRATFSIVVGADEVRSTDRQVSLLLRDFYNAESELGRIELRLIDDDQRSFETNFQRDEVAFLTGRVIVRERDPAAQIDVVRYNPTDETLVVRYNMRDLSASEGEDYFVPARREIVFGPGQRNARLLIPLVQDSVTENDENFMIELVGYGAGEDLLHRVAVIIRDDD